MKRLFAAAIIAVSALHAAPAAADFRGYVSGNKLLDNTRQFQLGFVAGIHDLGTSLNLICVPDDASLGQITDVVLKYLRDNPSERHLSGSGNAFVALGRAFPCKPTPPASAPPKDSGGAWQRAPRQIDG